jgi:hypothetical protein
MGIDKNKDMDKSRSDAAVGEIISEVRREANLLKAGALQSAIFNSANFSSIATERRRIKSRVACIWRG